MAGAKWLVIAGALPNDLSTGTYVDLQPIFDAMKTMGVRVALDTSGEPLQVWARKGAASVEDITMLTGACSGCGQCRGHCQAELAAQDAVRMASQSSASVPSSVPA